MDITQCVGNLCGWGVLGVSEVVIKVEFGVVGRLLPLTYGNNSVCECGSKIMSSC